MSSSLAPGFYVAVPHQADPNFRLAVVLLLEANAEGALGVVINQESPLTLLELCRDHDLAYAGDPDKKVRRGGPVQPQQGLVLYGAEHRDPEGRAVIDDLHVSASKETLGRLCSRPDGRFQCYSGYAGWGPGQLESEIAEGAWIIVPAAARLVLDEPPERVWEMALRTAGIDPAAIVPGSSAEA